MAVKVLSLRFAKKISRWVPLNVYFSSLSCASELQSICERDEKTLSSIEFEEKIGVLKSKLHPDSLIWVLNSTHDVNSYLKLFEWASLQKRFRHNVDTYICIITKLGMEGMIEEMEGFCKVMVKEKFPGSEEALFRLLDLFVKERRLDEALRVLDSIRSGSFKIPIGVFNVLLAALVEEKKDLQSVLFVYKEMVKVGILPTVDTLNCLLEALFEANQVDLALSQYRRMGKKGCSPNSRTFEIVISNLIARNRKDGSLVILTEMSELGCEPDLKFYNHIIPLLCLINELEIGMRLFKTMRASNIVPDSLTYGVLIHCSCENLCVDDAISFLDEMKDLGLKPPDHVFFDIINGFCKSSKLYDASMFLQECHVLDVDSHNALLEGYCNSGDLLRAKRLFDRMVETNIDNNISWNNLLKCLAQNTGINKTLEFLCRMIVSSFIPESATYSSLIIANCKAGKLDDALKLFNQVCDRCWVLDEPSYAVLVQSLCHKEKIHEAVEVFCYMSGRRCMLLSSSFNLLVAALCETGKVETAVRLFSLTNYSGTSCSSATYSAIMLGLSRSKKIDDLFIILARMYVEGCPLNVEGYCIFIRSMTAVGRTKDSVVFFKLMLSEGLLPDPNTLATLFSFLAKQSQFHIILSAIDKIISNAEILSPAIYNTLVHGIWKEGYRTEASRLLDIMLGKGWIPDASTHKLLISSSGLEEIDNLNFTHEKVSVQDKVSSILAEGLA